MGRAAGRCPGRHGRDRALGRRAAAATRHHGRRGKLNGTRRRTSKPAGGARNPRTRSTGAARSMAPHHRRRRWAVAILSLIAVVLLLTLLLVGGGGAPSSSTAVEPHAGGFIASIGGLAGGAAGSLTTREARAESGAINRTLAYTPYVRIAGAQHREIALTFDDGPGPYTPQIAGDPPARARGGDVLRGRDRGALLQRLDHGDRRRRRRDRRPHRGARAHVEAVGEGAASAAARPGERDRALRRAIPAAVPAAVWIVERDDAQAPAPLPDADGAVDGRHQRLPHAGRPGDRRRRRRWGPARSDHPDARRRRRSLAKPSRRCRASSRRCGASTTSW